MRLRGYLSYTQAFIYYRNSKGGALPDKDQAALPRQPRAEPRSLNDCAACSMQASQVSVWPGAQSGSSVLKGMINLAPKTK